MRKRARVSNPRCPKCRASHTWKRGTRISWSGGKKYRHQAYQCQECGHQWVSRK